MSGDDISRRGYLMLAGATTAGLAGCSGDNGESEERDTNFTEPEPTPEPEYSLESSDILEYDLSELEPGEPLQHDEEYIRQNYSNTPELRLLENGEEASWDQVNNLYLETEDEEELKTENGIPEYAVQDDATINITAELENGETLQTQTTVEKKLPEHYILDITINGTKEPWLNWIENMTGNTDPEPYTTPYQFDQHNTDLDQFYETRKKAVENRGGTHVPEAIRKAEYLDFQGLDKQEKIAKVSNHTNDIIPGASAAAQTKANAMERILRKYTDIDEPIIAGGFGNPAHKDSKRGNHGSQLVHADGDNYHSETFNYIGEGARHISEVEDIGMVSAAGSMSDYVSVIGELTPEFRQVQRRKGQVKLNGMIPQFVYPSVATGNFPSAHDNASAFKVRDLIKENKYEEALLGEIAIIDQHNKTGRYNTVAKLDKTVRAISSIDNTLNKRFYRDGGLRDGESVMEEIR